MPTEFRLPELGEGIAEADVIRVLVHEGDTIAVGQAVATIETEKATVDVPSEVAGTVTSIAVKEGQTVSPGTVILAVDSAEALALAWRIESITADLAEPKDVATDATDATDAPSLGVAPQWLAKSLADRLPRV
ncbi:MAG: biotin/lipoyl-containing protein, partial [Chloroflexota bacterium]